MKTTSETNQNAMTKNKTGFSVEVINAITAAFIQSPSSLPSLEIGPGSGFVALQAISSGHQLVCVDSSDQHLDEIAAKVPSELRAHLQVMTGIFPQCMDKLKPKIFGQIGVFRIIHFLKGDEIELGLKKLFERLSPLGKVYCTVTSIYSGNWHKKLVPVYQKRIEMGEAYPGMLNRSEIENFSENKWFNAYLPDTLHLFTCESLVKFFTNAGFIIEYCEYLNDQGILDPQFLFDGREGVGLIAQKPNS